jgi:predicted DNA-binding protein with PD1-like motif
MISKEKMNLIFIKLFPEEDVNDKLKEVCKNHNVKAAVIISGIGQLKEARLGYFKEKDDYSPEYYNKPLEILSLTGNIIKQSSDYFLHLHAVLGDESKNAFGGHFIDGTVSITAEIVILKTNLDLKRKIKNKTGLQDLYLE